MKTVLFLIYNENTLGLYDKFAEELKNNNCKPLLLDLQPFKHKDSLIDFKNTFVTNQSLEYIEYDANVFVGENRQFEFCLWFFNNYKFDLLVVPFEYNIIGLFVHKAQEENIPTLHIQHGLHNPGRFIGKYASNSGWAPRRRDRVRQWIRGWFAKVRNTRATQKEGIREYGKHLPETIAAGVVELRNSYNKFCSSTNVECPLASDYIAVPSRVYKEMILNEVKNYSAERILVTGHLRNNIVVDRDSINLHEHFSIPSNQIIASYFFVPYDSIPKFYTESYSSFQALVDFINCIKKVVKPKDVFSLVLVHPFHIDCMDRVNEKLIAEGIDNYQVTTAGNRNGAIYKQSLIIGGTFTAALTEARALNRRVLKQDYVLPDLNLDIEFQKVFEGITIVYKKDDLQKAIARLIDSPPPLECELVTEVLGDISHSSRNLCDLLFQKQIL